MLKILGDINFTDGFFDMGFGVGSVIKGGSDPFANLPRFIDDYWIGNFECVCSSVSNKKGTHANQFRIEPEYLAHVRHLDLYGVANNHVMQHGENAYNEMLEHISSFGASYFGTVNKRSHTFIHQGKSVSISGFNQRPENFSKNPLYWAMPNYKDIEKEFNSIRSSDFKIAYIHWGNEFISYPYSDQRFFAHWLIDVGFDLVIGMHPHVLQGFEKYHEKYIFYSLGNAVFNMAWEPTQYSALISVDLEKDHPQVSYQYIHLHNYFPELIDEANVPSKIRFDSLNALLTNLPENEIYYLQVFEAMDKYRKANRLDILKNMYKLSPKDLKSIVIDYIKRR